MCMAAIVVATLAGCYLLLLHICHGPEMVTELSGS